MIKRLLISLLTLASVLLITFLLLHTVPGGPFDQERHLPPEIEQNLYSRYGLTMRGDQNFWPWFGRDARAYATYVARGELGPSLKYRDRDVVDIIRSAITPSLELGLYSLVVAIVFGIWLGMLGASRPTGWINRFLTFISSALVSFPSFVIAVILVLIFSFWIPLLPPALWEGASYRILPVMTLSAVPIAYLMQLTRDGIEQELRKDHVRTARAKGIPWRMIIIKHAFKNAASPILTTVGPIAAYLITGSFIVETIFAIPGLGKHFITAVIDRDYFLVMGITLVYASILIIMNWIVDWGYVVLDPRGRKV